MGLSIEQAIDKALRLENEGDVESASNIFRALVTGLRNHADEEKYLGTVFTRVSKESFRVPVLSLIIEQHSADLDYCLSVLTRFSPDITVIELEHARDTACEGACSDKRNGKLIEAINGAARQKKNKEQDIEKLFSSRIEPIKKNAKARHSPAPAAKVKTLNRLFSEKNSQL